MRRRLVVSPACGFESLCAGRGKQCLLATFNRGQVRIDHAFGIAVAHDPAFIDPHRFVTEAFHQTKRVRDEENRLVPATELGEFVEALVGEALVADGEHLVHQQDIRVHVDGDGKPEAHVHAG